MAISIYSNGDNIKYGIKHYIIDFETELKKLPTDVSGSTVYINETSKYYMLNNQKKWIKIKDIIRKDFMPKASSSTQSNTYIFDGNYESTDTIIFDGNNSKN